MDHRLQPTLEAVESTRSRDWKCGVYRNRRGVLGTWIQIQHAGQTHKISVPGYSHRPEPEALSEAIRGVKHLDSERTWLYETCGGVPGFSTTVSSAFPSLGPGQRHLIIGRSNEFRNFA